MGLKFDIRGTGRWGRLRTFQAPYDLVDSISGSLVLTAGALSMFLPLLRVGNVRASNSSCAREAKIKMGIPAICVHSGLSESQGKRAMREVIAQSYLSKEKTFHPRHKEYRTNEYTILHDGIMIEGGGILYFSNNIQYMLIPTCFVTERYPWSLCNLSSPEISMYVAVLWLAAEARTNEFTVLKSRLQHICHQYRTTFNTTLASPALRSLFSAEGETELAVALLDPYTGQKIHPINNDPNDPSNYYIEDDGSRDRRLAWNYTEYQTASVLRSCNLDFKRHKDDYVMGCVFHDETKHSLRVHIHGFWHCFGCGLGAKKHLIDVVMKVLDLNGAEAIKHICRVTGIEESRLRFREFKSNAEAIYQYFNEQGTLIKEKLRFPNKEFQWRVFHGRKKPLLYHADKLYMAEVAHRLDAVWMTRTGVQQRPLTVIVTEGEKNADAVAEHGLLATTSGGATSWKDGHSPLLRNTSVVILPDHDQPGEDYANDVLNSCIKHGIPWKIVSFWPEAEAAPDVKGYDVFDYLQEHSPADLLEKIGLDSYTDSTDTDGSQLEA